MKTTFLSTSVLALTLGSAALAEAPSAQAVLEN